jgi:hypothetical protein
MYAPLSARRHVPTVPLDPTISEILHKRIRFDAEPETERESPIAPRRPKTRTADGRLRTTKDDMIADRRRAFDLRHQMEIGKAIKGSDDVWEGKRRYRDWKAKKTMDTLAPRRVLKDRKTLENVISERNEYFLDSLRVDASTPRTKMTQTRALPPEMRIVTQAQNRTYFWG